MRHDDCAWMMSDDARGCLSRSVEVDILLTANRFKSGSQGQSNHNCIGKGDGLGKNSRWNP